MKEKLRNLMIKEIKQNNPDITEEDIQHILKHSKEIGTIFWDDTCGDTIIVFSRRLYGIEAADLYSDCIYICQEKMKKSMDEFRDYYLEFKKKHPNSEHISSQSTRENHKDDSFKTENTNNNIQQM